MKAFWGLGLLAAFGALCLFAAPASATHWTGSGTLAPLAAFSGETVHFAFVLNNSANETLSVIGATMVACWHGSGPGSDLKADDGTNLTVPASSSTRIEADVGVPPLAPGLCHTTVVVHAQAASDPSPGYGDYHFDVNYSTRPAVTLALNASPLEGAPGLNVTFAATVGGGQSPYNLTWQFGDGTMGSGASVVHLYARVGRFNATAVAEDARGSRQSRSVEVWVFSGLSVTASAIPTVGQAPLTVAFVGNAGGAYGALGIGWQFGDGVNGTGFRPSHVFLQPGSYTVRFWAVDEAGAEANATVVVHVLTPMNVTIAVTPGADGSTFTFAATVVGGGANLSFHWSFSDGGFASGAEVSHRFAASGGFRVSVHVIDSASGGFATANATGNANGSPAAPPSPRSPGFDGLGAAAALSAAGLFVALRGRAAARR